MVRNGCRTIKHREYVQDILGSILFETNESSVNPGLGNLFAWLSGQAMFYQEYKFRKLNFVFETEKGSSTNGKVIFAFQQDATDDAPASKQELLENEFKAGGSPWQPFRLVVPMKNFALGKARYIRGGALAENLDQKTYDIGQLIVATQGMADASAVGELYVEYEVDLLTPIQNAQQLAAATSSTITGVSPTAGSHMGVNPTITGGLDLSATGNIVTFNRVGRYLVLFYHQGVGLFTTYEPASTGTATYTTLMGVSNAAGNAGTKAIASATVNVGVRGQTMNVDFSGDATSFTSTVLRIASYTAN